LRVLAIHRYYWPDTPPYASLLRAIVARWTDAGHEVEIVTSQPSYKPELRLSRRPRRERVDKALVRRIAMRPDRTSPGWRAFNAIWFPLVVAAQILLGRPRSVIMCSTSPPVVLGWAASLAARLRGGKFIYHCMDLHPEIGALSGDFSNRLVYDVLRWLDTATCRRAACVVVLSQDMKRSLVARDPALASKVVVLNNFELPSFDEEQHSEPLAPAPNRLRIAFTGNVGRFQGLDMIARALLAPDEALSGVQLVIMGEGAAKADLEAMAATTAPHDGTDRVVFLPHGSPAAARALLRTSDLGLVSLAPGVIDFAYPSKTATYLSEGLPLLVGAERASDLVDLVESNGIGGWLDTSSEAAVRACLGDWARRRSDLVDMASRAKRVWAAELAALSVLPAWEDLLDELQDGRAPAAVIGTRPGGSTR
jgi:glycosyltransferase involved in cell wall biosynthesis